MSSFNEPFFNLVYYMICVLLNLLHVLPDLPTLMILLVRGNIKRRKRNKKERRRGILDRYEYFYHTLYCYFQSYLTYFHYYHVWFRTIKYKLRGKVICYLSSIKSISKYNHICRFFYCYVCLNNFTVTSVVIILIESLF